MAGQQAERGNKLHDSSLSTTFCKRRGSWREAKDSRCSKYRGSSPKQQPVRVVLHGHHNCHICQSPKARCRLSLAARLLWLQATHQSEAFIRCSLAVGAKQTGILATITARLVSRPIMSPTVLPVKNQKRFKRSIVSDWATARIDHRPSGRAQIICDWDYGLFLALLQWSCCDTSRVHICPSSRLFDRLPIVSYDDLTFRPLSCLDRINSSDLTSSP